MVTNLLKVRNSTNYSFRLCVIGKRHAISSRTAWPLYGGELHTPVRNSGGQRHFHKPKLLLRFNSAGLLVAEAVVGMCEVEFAFRLPSPRRASCGRVPPCFVLQLDPLQNISQEFQVALRCSNRFFEAFQQLLFAFVAFPFGQLLMQHNAFF